MNAADRFRGNAAAITTSLDYGLPAEVWRATAVVQAAAAACLGSAMLNVFEATSCFLRDRGAKVVSNAYFHENDLDKDTVQGHV